MQTKQELALHYITPQVLVFPDARLDKLRPSIHANSFHLTTIGNSSLSYSLKLGYTGFLGVLGGSWHSISSGIDSGRLRNVRP